MGSNEYEVPPELLVDRTNPFPYIPERHVEGQQGRYIAYVRTEPDGKAKWGRSYSAQVKKIRSYVRKKKNGSAILAIYDEAVPDKFGKDRPMLEKAIRECRKHKARLIVSHLDRLSSNLAVISAVTNRLTLVPIDVPGEDMGGHMHLLQIHLAGAVLDNISKRGEGNTSRRLRAAIAKAQRPLAVLPLLMALSGCFLDSVEAKRKDFAETCMRQNNQPETCVYSAYQLYPEPAATGEGQCQ